MRDGIAVMVLTPMGQIMQQWSCLFPLMETGPPGVLTVPVRRAVMVERRRELGAATILNHRIEAKTVR